MSLSLIVPLFVDPVIYERVENIFDITTIIPGGEWLINNNHRPKEETDGESKEDKVHGDGEIVDGDEPK